jgi:hypothetical protein
MRDRKDDTRRIKRNGYDIKKWFIFAKQNAYPESTHILNPQTRLVSVLPHET